MIRPAALRTSPFSFRSLSSALNGRIVVQRSPISVPRKSVVWFSSINLLDAEPSDNPELYDILLADVDHRMLHGAVSESLDCDYLSRATKTLEPKPELNGIMFGRHYQPFFSIPTTFENRSYNLHFLFDTGSPFTYVSYDVSGDPLEPGHFY